MGLAVRAENDTGTGSFVGRLLPVDRLLLVYLTIITVVAVIRAPRQPECWWLLPAHALFVLLLYLIRRRPLGATGQALGEIYPLILLVGLYSEVGILNGHGVSVHDGLVQRWETAVFGVQVSRAWWQDMPSRVASTVLHAAYFSYYLIVTVPALIFLRRRQTAELRRFVFTVMATFVACYLAFVFFPVAGPYYLFPRPSDMVHRQSPGTPRVRNTRGSKLVRRGVSELTRRGRRRGDGLVAPGESRARIRARDSHGSAFGRSRVLPDALCRRCGGGAGVVGLAIGYRLVG